MICAKLNDKKLQKLQERALKFVYKSTVSTYKGDFLSVNMQRIYFPEIQVHKCVNNLSPKYLNVHRS